MLRCEIAIGFGVASNVAERGNESGHVSLLAKNAGRR